MFLFPMTMKVTPQVSYGSCLRISNILKQGRQSIEATSAKIIIIIFLFN